jgi:hypothetical protein
MAKFNLSKLAQKSGSAEPYPKRLSRQNDDRGYSADSGKKVETIQGMLGGNRKEGIDEPSTVTENLMSKHDREASSPTTVFDNQADNRDSYIPHRQHDGEPRPHIKPNDLLAESYDQRYYERFANSEEAANTAFWDKEIGVQLSGEKTTIVSQVPDSGSQLQNHPDRFKKVKDENGHVDPSDSDGVLKSDKKMTATAQALYDIDQKLFKIYFKAAKAERELTTSEQKEVDSLTVAKTNVLSG